MKKKLIVLLIVSIVLSQVSLGVVFADGNERNESLVSMDVASDLYGLGIVYNSELYVSVGKEGAIQTSQDGEDWQVQNSNTDENLHSVTWGKGQYIAVGEHGTVVVSPDATQWTPSALQTDSTLFDIVWSGEKYLAVGQQGKIFSTTDGVEWTLGESGTSNDLTSVAFNDGQYVAVGDNGTILVSDDGEHWTPQVSGTTQMLHDVIWGNNEYIAVGKSRTILASKDGIVWENRSQVDEGYLSYYSIHWNGQYYAIAGNYGAITTSRDGVQWTTDIFGLRNIEPLYGVVWGKDKFVATGRYWTAFLSPQSEYQGAWNVKSVSSDLYATSVTYAKDQYIKVGRKGKVEVSKDGNVWSARKLNGIGETYVRDIDLYDILYAEGKYMAVGSLGTIIYSQDAENWVTAYVDATVNINAVAWSGTKYIAVGDEGMVFSSEDGKKWTSKCISSDWKSYWYLNNVAWANNQFVIAADGGKIFVSPDGVEWTPYQLNEYESIQDVTYGQGRYVAVSNLGRVYTFEDMEHIYSLQAQPLYLMFSSVTFGGGQFFATGNDGVIVTSSDGIVWEQQNTNTFQWLGSAVWANNKLVAVGNKVAVQMTKAICVVMDGKKLASDTAPVIINDRTMVPFRAIFEALDAQVTWDAKTKEVTGTKKGVNISLTIGSDTASVNGTTVKLDAAPTIINNRTMVPLRFVSENLGATVNWDNATKTVTITTK